MDFFNSDKLKSMAQSAGKDLKSFGQQAASATQTVANAAKTAAEKAAQDARHAAKDMKQAANQIGNKAGSMVGMTVVVGGKNLYIESLLAEGGFGSVYTAVPIDSDPTKQAVAQEKVVLKRMFAGVSVRDWPVALVSLRSAFTDLRACFAPADDFSTCRAENSLHN